MKQSRIHLPLVCETSNDATTDTSTMSAAFYDSGHIPAGMTPVYCETNLYIFQNDEGALYWNSRPSTTASPLLHAFRNTGETSQQHASLPYITGASRCGRYIVIHAANTLHLIESSTTNSSLSPRYLGTLHNLASPPAVTVRCGAAAVTPWQQTATSNATIELDIEITDGNENHIAAYLLGENTERKISIDTLENVCRKVASALSDYDNSIAASNLFSTPFFICAAWRLADGTHTAPSIPQLMIPCSAGLMAMITSCVASDKILHLKLSIIHRACSLYYRLSGSLPPYLEAIGATHLDFFITSPAEVENKEKTCFSVQTCNNFSQSGEAISIGNGSYRFDDYSEHRPSGLPTAVRCFRRLPLPAENIEQQLFNADVTYKVASISINEIKADNNFHRIKAAASAASELIRCDTYHPDSSHYSEITARSVWNCDGALWLADPSASVPSPTVCEPDESIKSRFLLSPLKAGNKLYISDSTSVSGWSQAVSVEGKLGFSIASFGLGVYPREKSESATSPQPASSVVKLDENLMYGTSGNPFSISLHNVLTAGTGTAIAVAPSFKVISTASSGYYPLYAFTGDGIWALAASDQKFHVIQRVSGHKCLPSAKRNGGIALMPGGCAFYTRHGIVIFSGSSFTEQQPDTNIPEALTGFPLMTDESTQLLMTNAAVYSPLKKRWTVTQGRNGLIGYFYDPSGNILGYTSSGVTRRLSVTYQDISQKDNENILSTFSAIYDGSERKRLRSVIICGGDEVSALEIYGSDNGRDWHLLAKTPQTHCRSLIAPPYRLYRISVSSKSPCHALLHLY